MTTGNDLSDWMSVSGCRRQPCKRATQIADLSVHAAADGPGKGKTSPGAPATRPSRRGPIDWIEFFRGLVLLGMLCGSVWVEWVLIKSLAVYCSQFFGG